MAAIIAATRMMSCFGHERFHGFFTIVMTNRMIPKIGERPSAPYGILSLMDKVFEEEEAELVVLPFENKPCLQAKFVLPNGGTNISSVSLG